MFSTLFTNTFLQLLHSIGALAAVGFLVARLNAIFYSQCGAAAARVARVTGIIGTPVHEFGHAFFCLLFRHKIHEIKFYAPRGNTFGHVRHSFNPRSFYQKTGRFFIGIGPIPFGAAILALLLWMLLPHTFEGLHNRLRLLAAAAGGGGMPLGLLRETLSGALTDFFSGANIANPLWWLYLVPAFAIALHVNLSKSDIEGALPGASCFVLLVTLANVIAFLFGAKALASYNAAFLQVCMLMTGTMLLCVFFCLLGIAVALPLRLVSAQLRRHG
ncbi:MAG: hypothetical protein LBG65_03255 [Puniceicoccales bacterium]|jgi:hypothetical protein|nr:hypothetical protein [Puniceicoccales bacterium]